MLLEMMFCIGFFVVPLIGMFILVIKAAMKTEWREEKIESWKKQQEQGLRMLRMRKQEHTYSKPVLVFAHPEIMDYQLKEGQAHRRPYSERFKGKANPRAGP